MISIKDTTEFDPYGYARKRKTGIIFAVLTLVAGVAQALLSVSVFAPVAILAVLVQWYQTKSLAALDPKPAKIIGAFMLWMIAIATVSNGLGTVIVRHFGSAHESALTAIRSGVEALFIVAFVAGLLQTIAFILGMATRRPVSDQRA